MAEQATKDTMRKPSPGRVFVGDIVRTTDNFLPKCNKTGLSIPQYGKKYRGFIVSRRGDDYGVRFGEGLDFTNQLDGLLKKPVGAILKREEFEVEDL